MPSALGYNFQGCWKAAVANGTRPTRLEGSHEFLLDDYHTRTNASSKCAQVSKQMGYDSFALQDDGMCFGALQRDATNYQFVSGSCDDGMGGCNPYKVHSFNSKYIDSKMILPLFRGNCYI